MRERFTVITEPETGGSKLTASRGVNRSRPERSSPKFGLPESSTQIVSRDCGGSSNTFVAICAVDDISLLKTWVSTHTLKAVAVSLDCRFAWR
jgi:hypothetical protein